MMSLAGQAGTRYHRFMPYDNDPLRLSAKEAAAILGVPVHRVYILVNQKRLRRYKRGQSYRIGYYNLHEVEALKNVLQAEADTPDE